MLLVPRSKAPPIFKNIREVSRGLLVLCLLLGEEPCECNDIGVDLLLNSLAAAIGSHIVRILIYRSRYAASLFAEAQLTVEE
jgi:hypothetical protein